MPSFAHDEAARTEDGYTRAMSRLDGCPNCLSNTELPGAALMDFPGWRCLYRCSDCGHQWDTGWSND